MPALNAALQPILQPIQILTLITFLPLAGAIVLLFMRNEARIKQFATAWSLIPLLLSALLWFGLDPAQPGFQFEVSIPWIPPLGVYYHVGVDGLSVPLIFLTTLLTTLGLWYSNHVIGVRPAEAAEAAHPEAEGQAHAPTSERGRVKEYYALFLLLATGMLGVFVALDLFLFYVFFEIGLVPMYFLIGIWGGPRREYAAIKFFLYTLAGSVLMLLSIIAVAYDTGSFSLVREGMQSAVLAPPPGPMPFALDPGGLAAILVFLGFFLALAIKVPLFPFHTWLPDAHVEAPTAGSVILAGVLLKLGTYGFVRILMPLFPVTFQLLAIPIAFLAFTSIVYGALVAMAQWDFKKLIAYSSVNHMGYVILGLCATMAFAAGGIPGVNLEDMRATATNGAVLQMFNHGIITGALFMLVGLIYDNRTHERDFRQLGSGLWRTVPRYGTMLLVAAFASLGLPGLSGFISEFMVFAGSFGVALAGNLPLLVMTALSVLGILFTAAFFLWKVIGMLLLGPQNPRWVGTPDLSRAEMGMLAPLVLFMFLFGIYPKPILDLVNSATLTLLGLIGPLLQPEPATTALLQLVQSVR
jgi:NADH-quinone oxidoreductase subunit M